MQQQAIDVGTLFMAPSVGHLLALIGDYSYGSNGQI